MAGIFPKNGVMPSEASNAYTPQNVSLGCEVKYYPKSVAIVDTVSLNAIISELAAAADLLGIATAGQPAIPGTPADPGQPLIPATPATTQEQPTVAGDDSGFQKAGIANAGSSGASETAALTFISSKNYPNAGFFNTEMPIPVRAADYTVTFRLSAAVYQGDPSFSDSDNIRLQIRLPTSSGIVATPLNLQIPVGQSSVVQGVHDVTFTIPEFHRDFWDESSVIKVTTVVSSNPVNNDHPRYSILDSNVFLVGFSYTKRTYPLAIPATAGQPYIAPTPEIPATPAVGKSIDTTGEYNCSRLDNLLNAIQRGVS